MYVWRLEQEAGLRKAKGSGMTDDQVVEFVNGCMISTISSMGAVKAVNNSDRLSGIRTLHGTTKGKCIRHRKSHISGWEREETESDRPVRSGKWRGSKALSPLISINCRFFYPCGVIQAFPAGDNYSLSQFCIQKTGRKNVRHDATLTINHIVSPSRQYLMATWQPDLDNRWPTSAVSW